MKDKRRGFPSEPPSLGRAWQGIAQTRPQEKMSRRLPPCTRHPVPGWKEQPSRVAVLRLAALLSKSAGDVLYHPLARCAAPYAVTTIAYRILLSP